MKHLGGNDPDIVGFSKELFLQHEEAFLGIAADVPGEYWQRVHFLSDLPGKWDLSFALLEDETPFAYAVLSRRTEEVVHLHHFMVSRTKRSSGYGTLMLEECISRATKAGATLFSLKTASHLDSARNFYKKHGFEENGAVDGYLSLQKTISA